MQARTTIAMLVAIATATLISAEAAAVPATTSFTARIATPDGAPVDGELTVTFRIFDAGTGGTAVWEEIHTITAADGLLYAELGSVDPVDNGLDASVFTGDVRFLELQIGGETLAPRLALVSVPYAIVADHARVAERLGALAEDDVQVRIAGSCPAGQAIRGIDADGTVLCEVDDDTNAGGDITSVTAGSGLAGGGASGAVSLSVDATTVQSRVGGSCPAGQAIRAIAANGAVTCEVDDNAGGDITGVSAGTGLSGGGASGTVGLSVDTTVVQARIAATCPAGQAIRAIAADGSVTCEVDDDTSSSGDITSVTANNGLTGGGTAGALTIGIASLGVGTGHIANGAVTMAKTSAPIGVVQSTAAMPTAGVFARSLSTAFTADSTGACFVDVSLYTTNPGQLPVTYLLLEVAADANGTPVDLSSQVTTYSPDVVTTISNQGTVQVITHHFHARASYVVPVTAGTTYGFGCAYTHGNDAAFPNGAIDAVCQASYVCQ